MNTYFWVAQNSRNAIFVLRFFCHPLYSQYRSSSTLLIGWIREEQCILDCRSSWHPMCYPPSCASAISFQTMTAHCYYPYWFSAKSQQVSAWPLWLSGQDQFWQILQMIRNCKQASARKVWFSFISFAQKATSGAGHFFAGLALSLISFPTERNVQPVDIPEDVLFKLGIVYGPSV